MMDYVSAKQIISPISGQPVRPKIVEIRTGNKIIKEAHWIDPASGSFIRKGVISVEEVKEN